MTNIELAPLRVAGRAGRLRMAMRDAGCDALVVTNLVNVRWLTGFTGSAAVAFVSGDAIHLVTDGRYGEQAEAQMHLAGVDGEVHVGLTAAEQGGLLSKLGGGINRVGLEAGSVTWAAQRSYASETFASSELVATTKLVEGLRAVKDEGEIDRLAAAASIADDALGDVIGRLAEGPIETDFALELDFAMRRRGADGPSFETIVAGGPGSARPHHRPDSRRIAEGDLVVVDFGATVDGYHSDMTRTFVVGDPTPQQRVLLDLVTEAQAAGVAAVRAGVPAHDVDRACRSVIEEAGFGEHFTHGTGHGIGLVIHEEPFLARVPTVTLQDANVITVEPGVYLSGVGGVRVEDSLLVTRDGSRTLTHFSKDAPCRPSPPTT
jgi:Xaa-Pro aminopeptidase